MASTSRRRSGRAFLSSVGCTGQFDFALKLFYGGYWSIMRGDPNRQRPRLFRQKTYVINRDECNIASLYIGCIRSFDWNTRDVLNMVYKIPGSSPTEYALVSTDEDVLKMLDYPNAKKEVELYVTVDRGGTRVFCPKLPIRRADSEYHPLPTTLIDEDALLLSDGECELAQPTVEMAVDNDNLAVEKQQMHQADNENRDEEDNIYDGSDAYAESENSYHSLYSSDNYESGVDEIPDNGSQPIANDPNASDLIVGTKFADLKSFKSALLQYCILHECQVRYIKSDSSRVTARCAEEMCTWRIHASKLKSDGITFQIKRVQGKHTCPSVNVSGNAMATKFWIADQIFDWVKEDHNVKVRELSRRLAEKYNLKLPYQKVWRGKEIALSKVYGSYEHLYAMVPTFKAELMVRNPGSVIHYQVEEENNKFRRFFVCFKACSAGFVRGCRPLIGLDGCHLKGKYLGILLAATALDGNNGLFPVAFAVVGNENASNWMWFMEALKEAIGFPEGLVFMSDRAKGIDDGIEAVYTGAEHRTCIRHLYKNFKEKYGGEYLERLVWQAASCYLREGFDGVMDKILKASEGAFSYLNTVELKKQRWSRCMYGETAKCHFLTNNLSESFNSYICAARYKPIIHCIDHIRQTIMKSFYIRRKKAHLWDDNLVPHARQHLINISRGLGGYVAHRSGEMTAEVEGPNERCVVDLAAKTCTCRSWQISGLPCAHAACLIGSARLNWDEFVDPCFTKEAYMKAYELDISPMPDIKIWMRNKTNYTVLPPDVKRPAGRPRKARIRDPSEKKAVRRERKCRRCGGFGHYAKKCKEPIRSNVDSVQVDQGDGETQLLSTRLDEVNQMESLFAPQPPSQPVVVPRKQGKNKGAGTRLKRREKEMPTSEDGTLGLM